MRRIATAWVPSARRRTRAEVVGAALYLTVAGMIGVALGALLRTTAVGIATFAGVFFVIPPLMERLPSSIGNHLTPYLPSNAGGAIYGEISGSPTPSPYGPGLPCCAHMRPS